MELADVINKIRARSDFPNSFSRPEVLQLRHKNVRVIKIRRFPESNLSSRISLANVRNIYRRHI
jgi:hypothetical protein